MPLYGGMHYGVSPSPYGGIASSQQAFNDTVRAQHQPRVPASPGVDPRAAATMANQRPAAWTAAGKALATREQQLYGGDLYGNQAATGGLGGSQGGGSGIGGPLGQSPVGVGVNPYGGQQGAQARLHYGQAPGVSVSGAAQQEINRQFSDVYGANQNAADLDLLRRAAFEGSSLNLDQMKAQSSANVDWQNLMARLYESALGRQNFGLSAMYGLG